MSNQLIQDLDGFVYSLSKTKIKKEEKEKIIKAVDRVQNAIEETLY